jgi:hypothetical protein
MFARHHLVTFTFLAMHVALAGTLLAIGIPHVARIEAQLASGYAPIGYSLFVASSAIALALAVGTAIGLILWARGSRRWLLIIDAASTLAAWSVLVLFVLANDLPLATFVLAPACLAMAIAIAWYERRRAKVPSNRAQPRHHESIAGSGRDQGDRRHWASFGPAFARPDAAA